MKLVIVHGGQTGVERGAHWGAVDADLAIQGYKPRNERDELGSIPEHVGSRLWRCIVGERDGGLPARTGANVALAHAILFVVQNVDHPGATRDAKLAFELAFEADLPRFGVDPNGSHRDLIAWVQRLKHEHAEPELRLMVVGPTASEWSNGEALARSFVSVLGDHGAYYFLPAGGGLRS